MTTSLVVNLAPLMFLQGCCLTTVQGPGLAFVNAGGDVCPPRAEGALEIFSASSGT